MPNYGARRKYRRRHGNGTGDGGLATVGRSVRQSGCDKEKRRATARGDDGRWEGRRAGSPPFGGTAAVPLLPLFGAGQALHGTVILSLNTVSTRWEGRIYHRAGGKCKSVWIPTPTPTLTGPVHPCVQFLQLPTSQLFSSPPPLELPSSSSQKQDFGSNCIDTLQPCASPPPSRYRRG